MHIRLSAVGIFCALAASTAASAQAPACTGDYQTDLDRYQSLAREMAGSWYEETADVIDVARTWTAGRPEPSSELTFANSPLFDRCVFESLDADLHEVTVAFDESRLRTAWIGEHDADFSLEETIAVINSGDLALEFPPRIDGWLSQTDSRGGGVYVCLVEEEFPLAGLLAAFRWLFRLVQIVVDFMRGAVMYSVVEDYFAVASFTLVGTVTNEAVDGEDASTSTRRFTGIQLDTVSFRHSSIFNSSEIAASNNCTRVDIESD